jgi:hypothetical protein
LQDGLRFTNGVEYNIYEVIEWWFWVVWSRA